MKAWLQHWLPRTPRAPLRVVLYTRAGCGLCDEMKSELARARRVPPFTLEEVDVSTTRELKKRFGLRIPVLEIEGEERFEGRLTSKSFAAALRDARRTSG